MDQAEANTDQSGTPPDQGRAKRGWLRPLILLVAVVAVMVLAWVFDAGTYLRQLQGWIKTLGAWGPVLFVLIYALATVLALPGTALSAVAGGLFGSVLGTITVSLGATLGASLAFLVARYLARRAVENWLAGNQKFQKLDQLTAQQGAVMVAITRLVPLFPFNLLNFGFGLTRVPFTTYVFYSWLCMLPGTILYVVGFDALFTAIAEGRVPWLLIGVLVLMALILTLLIKKARARLKEQPSQSAAS